MREQDSSFEPVVSGDDLPSSSVSESFSRDNQPYSCETQISTKNPKIQDIIKALKKKIKGHLKGKTIIKNFSNFAMMHPKNLAKKLKMKACDSGKTQKRKRYDVNSESQVETDKAAYYLLLSVFKHPYDDEEFKVFQLLVHCSEKAPTI